MPVLLDTHVSLPDGPRVRLRLPHAQDRAGVRELLHRLGLDATELDVQRLLHFDPRERVVVCATRWTGTLACLVGVGAMVHASGRIELLVADEQLTPGLTAELHGVLVSAHARRRAA